MSRIDALRAYLISEIESLEPFDFVALVPSGSPLHILELDRTEAGDLQLSVPGRPTSAPAIPSEMQSALRERGFTCEDAEDPTKPWLCAVESAEACIDLAATLHRELFGEAPDRTIDVLHGSHQAAHEAQQKLAVVRKRTEEILTRLIEKTPEQDSDGDFALPIGDVQVTVAPRALPGGPVVVRVFAVTNVNVPVVPELGLFLARLNFSLMFGRFALDTEHNSIWFDEMLLGEQFRETELRFAVEVVASTADEWDDRLKQMFGGMTYQEVLKSQEDGRPPPVKPGTGPGLYL